MAANADAASAAAAPAEPAAAEAAKSDFEDIKANELDELEAAFNAAPGPADAAADPDPEPEPEPEPQPSKEVVAKGSAAVAKKKVAVPAKAGERSTANQTTRVSVDLLETLMTTVRRTGADPQPADATVARTRRHRQRIHGSLTAPQPRHHRPSRRGDENKNAADRKRLGEVAPDRSRSG